MKVPKLPPGQETGDFNDMLAHLREQGRRNGLHGFNGEQVSA